MSTPEVPELPAEPTKTQAHYLSFIVAYIEGYGESPAESDIAEALRVSPPSVNAMVRKLEHLGFITREPGVPRSIAIPRAIPDLPRWTGKIPPRTVQFWAPKGATRAQLRGIANRVRPANPRSVLQPAAVVNVFTVSMTLAYTDPKVWRRIETPDTSLERLHDLIQITMGWDNQHMYGFFTTKSAPGARRQIARDEIAEHLRLSQLLETKQKRLLYRYDFGDDWLHEIKIEKASPSAPSATYPRCIGGEMACPHEDCGGIHGYFELAAGEHWMLEEFDIEFDAEAFDIDEVNKKLSRLRV